jgi:putative ABC transport system ATP-binding protein
MADVIINIEQLKRDYVMGAEIVHALKGVSFSISRGEFVAIMGSSGSGKTTLLNILGCLDQATAGLYEIDGIPVKNLKRNDLAGIRNRKIGFVFQSYNLLPRTTALENVELPLFYNHTIGSRERKERAKAALNDVGLPDRMYHTPGQLSGGQQQRVAIARSLVNDPVLILADEATGNLDTRTSYEIMELFQHLNESNRTIVLVTHEADIALFGKRTLQLKDGLLIKDNMVANTLSAANVLAQLQEETEV